MRLSPLMGLGDFVRGQGRWRGRTGLCSEADSEPAWLNRALYVSVSSMGQPVNALVGAITSIQEGRYPDERLQVPMLRTNDDGCDAGFDSPMAARSKSHAGDDIAISRTTPGVRTRS